MRKDRSLSNILDEHRRISVGAAYLVVGLLMVSLVALYLVMQRHGSLAEVLVVATLLAGVVLLALRQGYVSLRWRIEQADIEKSAVLASVHRDALTQVFTRSHFLETLQRHVYYGSPEPVGYMQVDMDNLKVLNDLNGHGAGDGALVHLANTIKSILPTAIIGRLGGDEFGIAVVGHDDKLAFGRLGQEILRRLGESASIGGRQVRLSATIGVALAPLDATDLDDLISKADLALYRGKRDGRSCVVLFDGEMLGAERHRRFVERELLAAIFMNELDLYYQPVFAADGMTLRSYEALVRWHHKVRGTITPDQFVPIAEQSDLIDKLGDWVLRRACADLEILGTGSVAVNVSAAQLRRPDFAVRFAAIVAVAKVDPRQLIVEITETVPLTPGGMEMVNLEAVRAMGVRLAIDDFGAGHASLQYLRGLSFDIIKIDRSYVSNLGTNGLDMQIVSAICAIARSMPVDVIAEGVETGEQLALLQQAGCTGLQGFLLGRPQPLGLLRPAASIASVAAAA